MSFNIRCFIYLILVLLCPFSQQIFAQEINRNVTINGQIFNQNKGVSDVYIKNVRANTVTISNDDGLFSITAKINDTLVFSNIAYTEKKMNITKYNYKQKMIVVLESVNNELDEVEVKRNNLLGYIDVDVSKVKEEKVKVSAKTLRLPFSDVPKKTPFEYKVYTLEEHDGILIKIINAFTGRTKKNNKLKEVLIKEFDTEKMFSRYSKAEYSQMLKIPIAEVDSFLIFCEQDEGLKELIYQKVELKTLDYFIAKSKEFKQLKKD